MSKTPKVKMIKDAKKERERLEKEFEEMESKYIIGQQRNIHTLNSFQNSPRVQTLNAAVMKETESL